MEITSSEIIMGSALVGLQHFGSLEFFILSEDTFVAEGADL